MKKVKILAKKITTLGLVAALFVCSFPTAAYADELNDTELHGEIIEEEIISCDTISEPDEVSEEVLSAESETISEDPDLYIMDEAGGYCAPEWEKTLPEISPSLTPEEAMAMLEANKETAGSSSDDLGCDGYVPMTLSADLPTTYPVSEIAGSELEAKLEELTPTRNQGQYGTCWAHASTYLNEAYKTDKDSAPLAEADSVDYSERHLSYYTNHNGSYSYTVQSKDSIHCYDSYSRDAAEKYTLALGGNFADAAQTLLRWRGAADEDVAPYPVGSEELSNVAWSGSNSVETQDSVHLTDVYYINISTDNGRKHAKNWIREHGAVGISFNTGGSGLEGDSGSYYNPEYNSFYNYVDNKTNHAVAVVGWNDNFSKNLFSNRNNPKPSRDGAWLVRNSWSTPDGGAGILNYRRYFWISYEDVSISPTAYAYVVRKASEDIDKHNLYYDSQTAACGAYGQTSWGDGSKTPVSSANVFKITEETAQSLKEISFRITPGNEFSATTATAEIYKLDSSDADPTTGTKVAAIEDINIPYPGVYTVPIPEENEIILDKGDSFSVVIKLETGQAVSMEAVSNEQTSNEVVKRKTATVGLNAHESYIGRYYQPTDPTIVWEDLTTLSNHVNNGLGNLIIHAITEDHTDVIIPNLSDADVTLSKDSFYYNGTARKPGVASVTLNGKSLTEGTDYTVSYSSNINAGNGIVTITARAGSKVCHGTKNIEFTISPLDLSLVTVTLDPTSFSYTGSQHKPAVSGFEYQGETIALSDKDYSVSYGENINAGTGAGSVTVAAKSANCKNSKATTFDITKIANTLALSDDNANVRKTGTKNLSNYVSTHDGALTYAITQALTGCSVNPSTGVFTAGSTLGSCKVTITAVGDVNHEAASVVITVTVIDREAVDLTVTQNDTVYGTALPQISITGLPGTVTPTMTYSGTLRNGTGYGPTGAKPTNAGTYTVRVSAEDSSNTYSGSDDFVIDPKSIVLTDRQKPTGKSDLKYSAAEQALINSPSDALPGTCTMYYAVTDNEPAPEFDGKSGLPDRKWKTTIPTKTYAGNYTVYYVAIGDWNHNDSETGHINVGIERAVPDIATLPAADEITYGQNLGNSTLTGGTAKYKGTVIDGAFAWENTETAPSVADSNTTLYNVIFTPVDSANFETTICKVKLKVNKVAYTGTKTMSTQVYSEHAENFVTVNLPELPDGASYAISGTVGGSTPGLINGTPVTSGTTLVFSTTSKPMGASATITIGVSGAINYFDYSVVVTVITKPKDIAGLTINGGDKEVFYGTADFTLTKAVAKPGTNGVTRWSSSDEDVASIGENTGTVTIGKTGTTIITARYESDTTVDEKSITLTVKKKILTIRWLDKSFVYDGELHQPTAVITGVKTGDDCTVSVLGGQTNAGNHAATAVLDGVDKGNYDLPVSGISCVFTISKASIKGAEITLGPALVYNGSEQTQTVSKVELDGTDITAYCIIAGNKVKDAGTYTLTVDAKNDSNYTGTVSKTFTVAKKAVTPVVTVTGTYRYTGSAITPSYTVTEGANTFAPNDYRAEITDNINVGQGKIKITAKSTGNYTFSDIVKSFDILKALHGDVSLTGSAAFGTTGMVDLSAALESGAGFGTVEVSSDTDGIIDGTPSVDGNLLKFKFKAKTSDRDKTAVIKVKITGADNYDDYYAVVTVTGRNKQDAQVTIAGGNRTVTYGSADITLSARAAKTGTNGKWIWMSSDTLVATVTSEGVVKIKGAGTTIITAKYESDTTADEKSIRLTVNPKTLRIVWGNTSIPYDGEFHRPTVTITGLISGDACTVNILGGAANAGIYTVTAALNGKSANNYTIASDDTDCDFIITRVHIGSAVVTLGPALSYTGAEQTQTVAKVELAGKDITTSCDISNNKATNVGSYTLRVDARAGGNYSGYTTKTFTIGKKLIVPVVSVSGSYTYTGKPITPDIIVKNGEEILSGSDYMAVVTNNVDAGTGRITVTPTADGNYTFAAVTGTFTIDKAAHEDASASGITKYGLTGTLDLAGYIEEGGRLGDLSVSDPQSVVAGVPYLRGATLSYTFKDDMDAVGKNAVITVPVTGAKNYLDYTVTVTLTVTDCEHANTEIRGQKEANCTEQGYTGDTYCTDCNKMIEKGKAIPTDPDRHSYDGGVITKEPTIFTEGERTYTCLRCRHTYTEPVDRLKGEEDHSDLIEDITGKDGKTKGEVKTEEKDDGSTETVITVGGEVVEKTVEKKDGETGVETRIWVGGLKGSYTYTGNAIKPEIHVYDGTKKLGSSDYSVEYSNNKNAGTGVITLKFKGSYRATESKKIDFTIAPARLGSDVTAPGIAIASSSRDQKPVPVMTMVSTGKKIDKKNFEFTYKDKAGNTIFGVKDPGSYKVVVTGVNDNFAGNMTVPIEVTADKKLIISNAVVGIYPNAYVYTGKPVIPDSHTLTLDGRALIEGTDYVVGSITNNVDPGTATIVFNAKAGNGKGYVGSKTATFRINKGRELKKDDGFTYSYKELVPYSKNGAKPSVTVRDSGVLLKEGRDYTLSYSGNRAITAGRTAEVTVKGKGNYKGNVTLYYAVIRQDLSEMSGTVIADDKVASNKGYKNPVVTITDPDGKKLTAGKDYEPVPDSYVITGKSGGSSGSAAVGDTISVNIMGKGSYDGTISVSYRYISAAQRLNGVKAFKIGDQAYTGKGVTLTDADLTNVLYTGSKQSPDYLVPGQDFTVAGYSNNVKTGTAKVTLKGIGNYGSLKTLSFKIVAKKGDYKGVLVDGKWRQ